MHVWSAPFTLILHKAKEKHNGTVPRLEEACVPSMSYQTRYYSVCVCRGKDLLHAADQQLGLQPITN